MSHFATLRILRQFDSLVHEFIKKTERGGTGKVQSTKQEEGGKDGCPPNLPAFQSFDLLTVSVARFLNMSEL